MRTLESGLTCSGPQGQYSYIDGADAGVGGVCLNSSALPPEPCHGVTCRPQETCQEKGGQGVCVPNYEATCWLWGDPHYHSFDGRDFDFQGTCNYVLVTTGCPGVTTEGLTPFTITTKNENRGNPAVSFVRLVTVTALSVNISIHKGEVGKVRVSPTGWSPEPPVEFVGRGGPCWPQSGAEHSLSSPRPETKWQPSNSNYSKNVTFCGELIEFTPL